MQAAPDEQSVRRDAPRSWRSLAAVVAIALVVMAALHWQRALSRARLGAQVAALAGPADVRMIASVDCVYCAAARRWFEANRVPFSECEIERDAACAAAYAALGLPGTPVILVRDRRLLGFDPISIANALTDPTSRPAVAQ